MISLDSNPFHDLFVTDSAPAEDFVRYFSPFLVPHLPELFLEGNVVLKGTQGCGKSMLLKLFQPEMRVAYEERKNLLEKQGQVAPEFPIDATSRNFIGAGVNLSKSGLLDIAQMLPSEPKESDYQHFTALFCDFLNYWLLRDLLRSLVYMDRNANIFEGLVNGTQFDAFVELLASQECWFGYLDGCVTFAALQKKVDLRVLSYRSWNARNIDTLDESILLTKTAIAEPLSRTVECLKLAKVIKGDVRVFLRIDQMEELWHRDGKQAILTRSIRQVINRIIGNRDLRVSFRIGTRRYAWSGNLSMPGGRQLEENRDYNVVDLDQRLRRSEDRADWLFGGFAEDVFRHRITAQFEKDRKESAVEAFTLSSFFGRSPFPHQLIEKLIVAPPDDPQKLLKLDEHWSPAWRSYLKRIYDRSIDRPIPKANSDYPKNPLDALLATAWGLQTGGVSGGVARRSKNPPENFPPWTPWWEKERFMLAVIQLVVRHQQNLFWWGKEKVLALSASNITLFLSICRETWDQWRRRIRQEDESKLTLKGRGRDSLVSWKSQAVAIDNVSKGWHRNFSRQPGRPAGDIRIRFIDEVGNWLRRGMILDAAMSYPGGNGFSLRKSDLERFPQLKRLLEEAAGWGDIYEVEHTTKLAKEKHRDPRKKYYLNPILSPHFQVPEAHTKEPLYEPVESIMRLASHAGALLSAQADLPFDAEPFY